MMRLRFLATVLGLSSVFAAACSGGGGGSVGDGGEGGEAPTPGAGSSGEGGSGGEGGGGCTLDATGTLLIEVTGLPEGVAPDALLKGPDERVIIEAELTLDDVISGDYTVTASRVFDEDPIVRTV